MRTLALAATLSATALVAPSIAHACSAPACWPGFFTPDSGATVPANVPGFYWRPVQDFTGGVADPSRVKLSTGAAPATSLAMTATALANGAYLLVPQQPLTPQTYYLDDQSTCGDFGFEGPSVSFTVAGPAAMPEYLGELSAGTATLGALEVATPSGSCSATVAAYQVPITLATTSQALPWRDVLMFETLVDGAVWRAAASINTQVPPGASWRGRATDLLYRTCDSEDPSALQGLSAGPHEVMMRASLPGSGIIAASDTITVELHCPGDPGGDGGNGNRDDDGGCSTTKSHTIAWLLVALVPIMWRRRRRS